MLESTSPSTRRPRAYRRLWISLGVVLVLSFLGLGYFGTEIYRQAPPIPRRVVTTDGRVLFTAQQIQDGQNVWQSIGGQEVGSIWGHGAYVAPDWSADWLHREASWLLDHWAKESGASRYASLPAERQAALRERLKQELRKNTYDATTGDLVVSPARAEAVQAVSGHYAGLFGNEISLADLRRSYAIPADTIKTPERRQLMNAFFFWAAWACGTDRPGSEVTYTQNWPPEPLIDNRPTGSIILWSVVSFVALLAGVGALVWYSAVQRHGASDESDQMPERDPLLALRATPSMKATLKYFWVVAALLVVQVGLGAITAHYGVEGDGFFGIPLAKWVPYAVARTWHTQLGIFWIATAWLATGLFVAPAVSGYEPKGQRFGINFLFTCLLVIVVARSRANGSACSRSSDS